jgi:hypothetical protein
VVSAARFHALQREVAAMRTAIAELPGAIMRALAARAEKAARLAAAQRVQRLVVRGDDAAGIALNNGLRTMTHGTTEQLVCKACEGTPGSAGFFNAAQDLPKLRFAVGKHLQSRLHIANVKQAALDAAAHNSRKERAMAVGRLAYQHVKEGWSYLSFPRNLQCRLRSRSKRVRRAL